MTSDVPPAPSADSSTRAEHVPSAERVAALRARVHDLFGGLRSDLEALVRIPSVSNREFDQAFVEQSAEAVAALLRGAGLEDATVLRVPGGAPAVVGHHAAPAGAPTVLLYAHHDVQPVGDVGEWQTAPFEPTVRGDRLFGRGAADDKAGVVAHVGALRALAGELGVGVTVFVEGEEEVGSPTFLEFLRTHREALAADVVVVADATNWKVGVPGLTTSLRGLVSAVVEVAVLDHPIHSGMYGGPVLDAPTLLARLIATLHDVEGAVAVAGLLQGPDPVVDDDEDTFRADAGLLDGVRLAGSGPITARLWTRPALGVIGLDAPRVATASNTIAPRASALLSLRVAPGQDPDAALAALERHVREHAPFGAPVTFTAVDRGRAFQAPADSPAMRTVRWALGEAWGAEPADIGVGGSIPFIAELLEAFPDAAILVTGVEDPDSRAHGPNESVHLGELERAVLAEVLLLERLAGR
ncbi:dipeptidase [Cellulomonas sp. T2.31MG-18]|uniref:dipeptidase n=1 Tax=Cellulomonas sp. T2.31MG-18 TaxID=3157619 RepID=UPI0036706C44